MTPAQNILLTLVRAAVVGESPVLPERVDWEAVMKIAIKQGVIGLCLNAVMMGIPAERPARALLMQWIAQVSYMEMLYQKHRDAVHELARFYDEHGIKMMLLKGYGLSLFWPVPERRPVGDMDIYLFGRWQEADRLVTEELGLKVNNKHHHHSVFGFNGIMVENHYDFLNVHSHKSNRWIEGLFKEMTQTGDCGMVDNVVLPSPTLNALYVLRHTACHFAAEKITLKQILDCAFLLRSLSGKIDRDVFRENVAKMGMMDFVLVIKSLCVNYLGFDAKVFPIDGTAAECCVQRILEDVLNPEDMGSGKKGLSYVAHRTKLWWRNRWKHRMVYSDTLFSTFVLQIKSHLMKPDTIFGK